MKSNCCNAPLEIGGGTHSTRWFICSKCGKACDANPGPYCSLCGEEPHPIGECPAGWQRQQLLKARRELIDEVARLRSAILQTIDENKHLADGDNCTLWRLVHAVKTKENEMSDTPRTDAARLWHFDEPVVPLDFASQLERELVEMKRENLVRQRSELRQELTDANNRASFFELVRVALGAETQMQALEIANRLRTDVEDWRIAAADFATNPDGLRCELLEQERVIAEQLGLIGGYRSELKELTKQRDHFKAEMESWIGQNTDRVADCLRLGQERDAWRKCAEHLKDAVCTALNCGGQQGFERDFCKEALAAFEKLKGKE